MSKRIFVTGWFFAAALFFAAVVLAARFVRETIENPLIAAGAPRGELKPETVEFLKALGGRVEMTAFLSPRETCPSAMKEVIDRVGATLDLFRAAAPKVIDVRVIDPGQDAEVGERYAAQKGASPITFRKVRADESGQEKVWSSIVVMHDRHPAALLQGIRPRDLDRLEDWLVQAMSRQSSPKAPVVAVAAPRGKGAAVRETLAKFSPDPNRGVPTVRVVDVDFERDLTIPGDADCLLWIAPESPNALHAAALARILDSGRSVVVYGAPFEPEAFAAGRKIEHRVRRGTNDWSAFLDPFGLAFTPVLLLDKSHDSIDHHAADGTVTKDDQPFHLRVAPSNFDTSRFTGPNTGALLVRAPAPIEIRADVMAKYGRSPFVVATTSENASALELPEGTIDEAALSHAWPVPKEPWIVLAAADDPWKGDLLLVSTASLVDDAIFAQGGNANPLFLQTLARTYTANARIVRARVPRAEAKPLPAVSAASRVLWRFAVVAIIPGVLFAFALRRARASGEKIDPAHLRIAAAGLAGVLAVGALAFFADRSGVGRIDITADRRHSPDPTALKAFGGRAASIEAELVVTDAQYMPVAMKEIEPAIRRTLSVYGIRPRVVRPEDLSADERVRLEKRGAVPFSAEVVDGDRTKSVRVTSALFLRHAGRETAIGRLDQGGVERLEFTLATAVERLFGAPLKRIGVLSDLPRVSPAEASDYQQKGYTAPVGSDVYSESKRLLGDAGYEVVYVNPEATSLPERLDALCWLQPRYSPRMIPSFSAFMAAGGKALVALQHYNLLQRQHRGAGFKTVYWPQPQFHRFNDYLELFGARQIGEKRAEKKGDAFVEVPGEVLFDRNQADLALDTNVFRSAFKELDRQQVARPFLVRANGPGLAAGSTVTKNLGNLLFVWPSRFTFDAAVMGAFGMTTETLVTTSDRTWTYPWSGGFIPDEKFEWPGDGGLGPVPLVADVRGRFPAVETKKDEQGRESFVPAQPKADQPNGRLVLIGSSEMFKNARIFERGYRNDRLLLNVVADLVESKDVAALAAKSSSPRGLPFIPAETKARWRAAVIGVPTAIFLLGVFFFRLLGRRAVLGRAR